MTTDRAVPVAQSDVGAHSQQPKCFVIAPIGAEGTETRRKSDRVLKYIVGKALQDKYEVQRADDIRRPGMITVQIIEQLFKVPLVVADLSEGNANVYYELAIRHAVKKPVIHLITKGQDAPFDVSQMRYVSFDITDPESIEQAQHQLKDYVEAIERREEAWTPIQFTQILVQHLGQSGGRETDPILEAFSIATANISEELRTIKRLISGTSVPMAQGFLTLRELMGPRSSWQEELTRVAQATEEKMRAEITRAAAHDKEKKD